MAVTIEWDNDEEHVLHYTFGLGWTNEELDAAYKTASEMTRDMTQRYDVIIDVTNVSLLPRNALQRGRDRYIPHKPNGGISVLVGANPMVTAIIKTLSMLAPYAFLHFRYAATLEDAYRLIRRNRAKVG